MLLLKTIFIICLLGLPFYVHASLSPPKGYQINCGATEETTYNNISWISDGDYIKVGNSTNIKMPDLVPSLKTLRYFPDTSARKYCYTFPVKKGANYLIRTTYFYGGFDGRDSPPVFDQIIEGTKWSLVDTRENYAREMATYYEVIVGSTGKSLSVCLARNENTTSSPFISAIELVYLDDSMYNVTDFSNYALSTVARHKFGFNGGIVSYPDDQYNRFWEPYEDGNAIVTSQSPLATSDFWNLPPQTIFNTGLTSYRGENLTLNWPPSPVPEANYYIALYFQDNRPSGSRVFDVFINGEVFYKGLNVSSEGSMVYSAKWPLSGVTKIVLVPDINSMVGPIINAAELYMIVPLRGRTHPRDVIGMTAFAKNLSEVPSDWSGDPCLPRENAWTGLICSQDNLARVVSVNLTNFGAGGSISERIANLTAIQNIWLGGNNLTGTIPEMSNLNYLVSLHLENNHLIGTIPHSLGNLPKIREIYLQNNNLQGTIPDNLKNKTGLILQVSPGNNLI